MDKIKVIIKIQKLLSLSKSPNENEAVAAASKARLLMDQYNLSQFDIGEKLDKDDISMSTTISQSRFEEWSMRLFSGVCSVMDCRPVISVIRINGKHVRKLSAVGFSSDKELLKYIYFYLLKTITDLYRAELKLAKAAAAYKFTRKDSFNFKHNFCLGAVQSIIDRLKLERDQNLQKSVNCRDLVINRKATVSGWVSKNLHLKSSKIPNEKTFNPKAYYKGVNAGSNIKINKALNN